MVCTWFALPLASLPQYRTLFFILLLSPYQYSTMPNRPVWLIKFRPSARQRAHFSIFIPFPQHSNENPNNKNSPCRGTIIHVVGTPVAMALQFKSNIACNTTRSFESAVLLAYVDDSLIVDQTPSPSRPNEVLERDNPIGKIEREALHIRPPRGGNVLAPVNDVRPQSKSKRDQMKLTDIIGDK